MKMKNMLLKVRYTATNLKLILFFFCHFMVNIWYHIVMWSLGPLHKTGCNTGLFLLICPTPLCINLDNNIPSKTFHGSIGSEILHIARKTSGLINMVARVNLLLIQMKKQGNKSTCIILFLKNLWGSI